MPGVIRARKRRGLRLSCSTANPWGSATPSPVAARLDRKPKTNLSGGGNMKTLSLAGVSLAAILYAVSPAATQDPVTIGFITTLSGPLGYAGEEIRDGFQLAMDEEQGKL